MIARPSYNAAHKPWAARMLRVICLILAALFALLPPVMVILIGGMAPEGEGIAWHAALGDPYLWSEVWSLGIIAFAVVMVGFFLGTAWLLGRSIGTPDRKARIWPVIVYGAIAALFGIAGLSTMDDWPVLPLGLSALCAAVAFSFWQQRSARVA